MTQEDLPTFIKVLIIISSSCIITEDGNEKTVTLSGLHSYNLCRCNTVAWITITLPLNKSVLCSFMRRMQVVNYDLSKDMNGVKALTPC